MKNLSWFNKAMYSLNIILVHCHFYRLYLPFGSKNIPILSVLTLFMPVFFYIEWSVLSIGVFNLKRMILSGIVLLIGITFINKFYKFSAKYPPDDKTLR
jgi:hypothetical protein